MAGKKKNYHVVPDGKKGWSNKKEGSSRPKSRHRKQRAAIDAAKKQAKKDGVEVVIHRKNGRIRDKDSYGNDPCPPRDKKH